MRFLFSAAVIGASLLAAPVLAWSDNHMSQPASNGMPVWAYNAGANYCPAGLQPVTIGGVICCGTPTHYGYKSHPAPVRKHKKVKTYVSYGKGYSEGTVVYKKGD